MSEFIYAVAMGTDREIALFGPRGEGKTWGAGTAMIAHAQEHAAQGHPLPVKWLGATSTFESHKQKTHDSLLAPGWKGCWSLHDSGHQAIFAINGQRLVDLRLFGVEDEKGMERLRAEAHCVWFEEAAPAEEIGAHGMSANHWGIAQSSMRLASHANVAMLTQNYPDEEHWTWTRFVSLKHAGTRLFEIPAEEWATREQRAAWAEAIVDPVMRARLIEGKPGTIIPGRPVAMGFNERVHVSAKRLRPMAGGTLWLGQDGGLRPATVIGQRAGARIEVLASLVSEHAGIRQHFEYVVIPWISDHAPWVLDDPLCRPHVCYDESMDSDSQADSETNPLRVMRAMLPGIYRPGQNKPWAWRRDPLLRVLSAMDAGQPLIVLDPEFCKPLIKAWRGMWHYELTVQGDVRKEEPKKPNSPWSDLGDASAYMLADMAPLAVKKPDTWKPAPALNVVTNQRVAQPLFRPRKALGVGFRPVR